MPFLWRILVSPSKTALDCWALYVLSDDERVRYVASLAEVVPAGAVGYICSALATASPVSGARVA